MTSGPSAQHARVVLDWNNTATAVTSATPPDYGSHIWPVFIRALGALSYFEGKRLLGAPYSPEYTVVSKYVYN